MPAVTIAINEKFCQIGFCGLPKMIIIPLSLRLVRAKSCIPNLLLPQN